MFTKLRNKIDTQKIEIDNRTRMYYEFTKSTIWKEELKPYLQKEMEARVPCNIVTVWALMWQTIVSSWIKQFITKIETQANNYSRIVHVTDDSE